jgi:uncharacterized SAM-binding protein YcdF (DUF218 family)
MSRGRRRLILIVLCGVLGTGLYLFRAQYLPALAHWLDVGQRPVHADYLMLLGGDDNTRPFAAAALVKAGFAPRVIFARGESLSNDEEGILPSDEEICRSILVRRGVPEEAITEIDAACESTFDEAQAMAKFFASGPPPSRVLVLTSDYHTRRARWVFQHVLGPRFAQLTFVSAPTDDFPAERWWCSYEAFGTVMSEYLKLGFYWIRYGQLGYWLAALCASLLAFAWYLHKRQGVMAETGPPDAPPAG